MIAKVSALLRRIRRWFSRTEWFARAWRLPPVQAADSRRGLVMIQIDGLAHHHLLRAVRDGQLPFIRRLLRRERYALYPMYSGLPATTPAIQAELFYGVRGAVPAFGYFDRTLGRMVRMYDADAAFTVEKRLEKRGAGLLEGGSAYSDIFTGGADEAHFCAASAGGWSGRIRARGLFSALLLLVRVGLSPRGLYLLALELGLGIAAAASGIASGQPAAKEIRFVFARLAVCVLLREYVTFGAMIDVARGVPVIHLNLLGYDEQAHRRGPSSAFARWSLKGIDRAVRDIWRAAHRSGRRQYDVWIYSDHGQEDAVPYAALAGESFDAAAFRVAAQPRPARNGASREEPCSSNGVKLLGGKLLQRMFRNGSPSPAGGRSFEVASMGPVGHLYLWPRPDAHSRAALAQRLVQEARVPAVLSAGHAGQAHAWTAEGRLELPGDMNLLAPSHPFLSELEKDLISLVHHPDSGDWVVIGWRGGGKAVALAEENGTHGGPGFRETEAFALVPSDTALPSGARDLLRPWDLRQAALHVLGRPTESAPVTFAPARKAGVIRVMTYNVHSCRGTDGALDVERVARVIRRHHPDVVALQEVDVGRARSSGVDQASELARRVGMHVQFFPRVREAHEEYGEAILSRHPMRLVRQDRLPGGPDFRDPEWRGAIWASIRAHGKEVNVINTHLSLSGFKARVQAEALMGSAWVGDPDCEGPVIVCGDLNSFPDSEVCRRFKTRLHDAQLRHAGPRPKKTWFSRFPVGRIDHIFVSAELRVLAVDVPDTELEKQASDHLPVIADLEYA